MLSVEFLFSDTFKNHMRGLRCWKLEDHLVLLYPGQWYHQIVNINTKTRSAQESIDRLRCRITTYEPRSWWPIETTMRHQIRTTRHHHTESIRWLKYGTKYNQLQLSPVSFLDTRVEGWLMFAEHSVGFSWHAKDSTDSGNKDRIFCTIESDAAMDCKIAQLSSGNNTCQCMIYRIQVFTSTIPQIPGSKCWLWSALPSRITACRLPVASPMVIGASGSRTCAASCMRASPDKREPRNEKCVYFEIQRRHIQLPWCMRVSVLLRMHERTHVMRMFLGFTNRICSEFVQQDGAKKDATVEGWRCTAT